MPRLSSTAPALAGPYPGRRARARKRVHVEVRRLDTNELVGQVYLDASQVRGELDRVDGRWRALKRAVASSSLPTTDPARIELGEAWASWRRFYDAAYDDWLAWSTNVAEADRWDREADAWRERLAELGVRVGNPTSSSTAPRPELPGLSFGGGLTTGVLLSALLVAGAVYVVTR